MLSPTRNPRAAEICPTPQGIIIPPPKAIPKRIPNTVPEYASNRLPARPSVVGKILAKLNPSNTTPAAAKGVEGATSKSNPPIAEPRALTLISDELLVRRSSRLEMTRPSIKADQ